MDIERNSNNEIVDIQTNNSEEDESEDKVMYYTFEQVLVLRKTLYDVVIEEKMEIPTPFRQDVITDRKGFFVIFGIIILVCYLVFTYCSLQIHDTNLEGNHFATGTNTSDYHQDSLNYLKTSWWQFLLIIILTIVLCVMTFSLIILFPTAVLRTAVCCVVLFFAAFIPASWALLAVKSNMISIICIIVMTVPSFFIIIFAARYCYSYTHLVGPLYKEAEKIILAMPGLLLLTLISILLQLIIVSVFITSALLVIKLETSLLLFLNMVVTNWALYFVEGFLCMVTAGSVTSWYNIGYEQSLKYPIFTNLGRVVKYHIGTIAFGSALHPSITLVRQIAKVLSCNFFDVLPSSTTSNPAYHLAHFSKKYAYVSSAMHGKSYIDSGRDAFVSFFTKTPVVVNLKEGADLGSFAIKLNLLLYPTGISCLLFWESDYIWLATIQCFFTNIIIVAAFLETVEIVAHTILTNLCEDEFLRSYFIIEFTKETIIARIK